MINLSNINKFLVAIVGVLGVCLSNGLVPTKYSQYVSGAIAGLSALGVYIVKNGPTAKEMLSQMVKDFSGRENVTS